ncbi:MAG: DMT family transporter [Myxococcota bacterium]
MRGILLMVAAAALFSIMAGLVKIGTTSYGYHPLELVLWRSLTSLPPALWLARRHLRVRARGWLLGRCLFGFVAMLSWFTASRGLAVGELSVLSRMQPIFVGIAAPWLLGRAERASPGGWLATGLGLLGSVVMVSPDLAGFQVDRLGAAGLALLAAITSALAHTCLRALGATDDPRTTVLWFQAAVGVFALGLVGLTGLELHVPPLHHLPVLLGIGLVAVAAQLLMTAAYQAGRAQRVATASYVGPVIGFAFDAVVFGVAPAPASILGAVLVLSAGGLLLRFSQLSPRA